MQDNANEAAAVPSKGLLAVIIPYFQREPGILRTCVASILEQENASRVHVVIADDESPVAPEPELEPFKEQRHRITLAKRQNGGPGAARNTALENLPDETAYVALMDSDDRWEAGFASAALDAMDRGYDLFFGNSRRYSESETRFDWGQDPGLRLREDEHRLVDEQRNLYEFDGDFFDFLVHRSNILGPSTTVYRRAIAPDLRFKEHIYNGQDRVFKLELCQYVSRVCFTPTDYGREGEGINIFDTANWGSRRSLAFLASYIEMSKCVLSTVRLSSSQRAFVRAQLADSRKSYVASLLHMIARREKVPFQALVANLRADPASVALFLPNVARAAAGKLSAGKAP